MSRPKLVTILLFVILAISACGRTLSDEDLNQSSSSTSQQATETEEASAEATDEPLAEATGEVSDAVVPDDPFAARTLDASVTNGETLFNQINSTGFACSSCHNINSEERLVGPGLLNIPSRAAQRVDGQSAYEYVHNSIVEPNGYVVESYPENLMPQVYSEVFTEDEIYDLAAYVMTLGEAPPAVVEAQPATPMDDNAVVVTRAPTATPQPTVTPTPIIVSSNLSGEVIVGLARSGIASYGEEIFSEPRVDNQSCADCHSLDGTENPDGPTLAGIVEKAKETAGEDVPEIYLYNALTDPDVHGTNLESTYGLNDIYNVIAYLMTLEESAEESIESADSDADVAEDTETPAPEGEATPEAAGDTAAEAPSDGAGDALLSAIEAADPSNGEALFTTITNTGFACSSCHNVASVERLVGPGLLGIPTRADERIEGIPAHEYIYQSITDTNAYVVADYPENLMPQVYTEVFTEEEIYDIIAYLYTLEES